MPRTPAQLWEFLVSREGVEIWLGPGAELPSRRGASYETANGTTGEIRSFSAGEQVQLTWRPKDWDHDSTLRVAVGSAGQKATLRFQQEWPADAKERAEQRAYWTEVSERVIAALGER
ncbi:SRPBCC domain-containing protein [Amycolatopsis sp. H20-H5]|uniref:SRPBCC domain-containing protein n=1 Tax=Amycolatopsis sp. H20-H5 TaxID=3046309 RepID=UPI002DBBA8FF|nr:SRPBCC domain-containing protein [Amycolatopsis sp. H20-H5]MEC3978357.1 SRPBCC domain-containing protein [Amycolatopsis sp. H20-H5]